MTIHLLEIPNEPGEWAQWLEDVFCSDRLGPLVDELNLVRTLDKQATTAKRLYELVSEEQLESVRQTGLGELSESQIQQLLANPLCLLEMQETLLSQSSEFWDSRFQASDLRQPAERIRQHLDALLSDTAEDRTIVAAPNEELKSSRRFMIGIAVAVAASFVGVLFWTTGKPRGSGRILGQSGLIANDVDSSSAYFNRIAEAGNTWFDHRPANKGELVALLSDVSNDCQILIDASHDPLTSSQREWFVMKCSNWKDKFDATLASLQAGVISVEEAQTAADKTMTKLISVLRAGPTA